MTTSSEGFSSLADLLSSTSIPSALTQGQTIAQQDTPLTRSEVFCRTAGIPVRYRGYELMDLKVTDGNRQAIELVRGFQWKPGEGVLLHGPVGTGKTHLAVALAKQAREAKVLFRAACDLLLEIKAAYDTEGATESGVLGRYSTVDVLVLDDLGAERVTEWTKQVFYTLVNRRYNGQRATIVTTNLTPNKLAEVFDERLVSRLLGMCHVEKVGGADWRVEKRRAERG